MKFIMNLKKTTLFLFAIVAGLTIANQLFAQQEKKEELLWLALQPGEDHGSATIAERLEGLKKMVSPAPPGYEWQFLPSGVETPFGMEVKATLRPTSGPTAQEVVIQTDIQTVDDYRQELRKSDILLNAQAVLMADRIQRQTSTIDSYRHNIEQLATLLMAPEEPWGKMKTSEIIDQFNSLRGSDALKKILSGIRTSRIPPQTYTPAELAQMEIDALESGIGGGLKTCEGIFLSH